MKLTKWYPEVIKPARVGLYEIKPYKNQRNSMYSYWNGNFWGLRCEHKFNAVQHFREKAYGPIIKWRGLAERP